ncbi:MAG: O-acetyl-ADP-ribose deacetylase [Cyclobacteriaceae bacterium]|jgi:O-acetyl-ADP-ribose deacetylase (regulator of RNase III)|nr:O-acetyl-ADP-ribose deacetylase [Cyclobacteriaceae bacterium]MDH4298639.1 O-acetyl-ADP-ribose deacetylase [Cyclobacteriaceae bacterium]MDH5248371.1 O-acetyl-ADP-ribose deacetylase [Cyclobacteriaceae bacterium]
MNRIQCIKGDITSLQVDVIVNAANNSLMGGGGVDGAIHRVGGPQILDECMAIRKRQGGCPTGEAVITTAGNLKAKFVIHTVGPYWTGNSEEEEVLLANAYRNCLTLAVGNLAKTIAFPNISTGIYGFPKRRAAEIAIQEVSDFLERDQSLDQVIFCCFDLENFEIYKALLKM